MMDSISDIFLLAIIMLFFTCLLNEFNDNIYYEPSPIERDTMFNKWRRIY